MTDASTVAAAPASAALAAASSTASTSSPAAAAAVTAGVHASTIFLSPGSALPRATIPSTPARSA